jgi:hypothetical protein
LIREKEGGKSNITLKKSIVTRLLSGRKIKKKDVRPSSLYFLFFFFYVQGGQVLQPLPPILYTSSHLSFLPADLALTGRQFFSYWRPIKIQNHFFILLFQGQADKVISHFFTQ